MTPRRELNAVLQNNPGPTIRVPRSLLLDVLHAMYRPDEIEAAEELAATDADREAWPLVFTGYTHELDELTSLSAGSPSKGGGSVSMGGAE